MTNITLATRGISVAALILLASGCRFTPMHDAQATPQRPTFSSDTNTTVEGTLEVEAGVVTDPGDAFSTPSTLKFGSGPATELFLNFTPFIHIDGAGESINGWGDLGLGVRHRVLEEEGHAPSVAFQTIIKLPIADDDIGTNEVDVSFATMASKNLSNVSTTGFYQLDVLGTSGGGSNVGHIFAAAAGKNVVENLDAFTELAVLWVPATDNEQFLLTLGAANRLSPSFVVDGAVIIGIGSDAPDFQLVMGVTKNLGRISRVSDHGRPSNFSR
jgi:hypothetical protein